MNVIDVSHGRTVRIGILENMRDSTKETEEKKLLKKYTVPRKQIQQLAASHYIII